jgi:hypothetical protein
MVYIMNFLRQLIKINENNNSKVDYTEFDTNEILYHGTNIDNILEFDRKYLKTARHFYTTPDIETAKYYGKYIYKLYGKQQPQLDLFDLTIQNTKILTEIFNDIYLDYVDYVIDSDELLQFKNDLIEILNNEQEDVDDIEVEDDKRYIEKLKKITISYLFDYIQSGNLYGNDGDFQNMLVEEIFSRGFNSVRMYDYSSTGTSISVVFDHPNDIKIIEKIKVNDLLKEYEIFIKDYF